MYLNEDLFLFILVNVFCYFNLKIHTLLNSLKKMWSAIISSNISSRLFCLFCFQNACSTYQGVFPPPHLMTSYWYFSTLYVSVTSAYFVYIFHSSLSIQQFLCLYLVTVFSVPIFLLPIFVIGLPMWLNVKSLPANARQTYSLQSMGLQESGQDLATKALAWNKFSVPEGRVLNHMCSVKWHLEPVCI